MNQLKGTIEEIKTHEGLSLVKVKTPDKLVFTSLVLEDARDLDWLKPGKPVKLLFKEIEVIISKSPDLVLSIQNRIPCVVRSLKIGEILGEVELAVHGSTIRSIVTANACRQLNLKENDPVAALIKTNEISLSPDD